MAEERRKAQRTPVSAPDEVVISGSGVEAVCRVRDLSPYGLRLEFTAPAQAEAVRRGATLRIASCEGPMGGLLCEASFTVVWKKGDSCGAQFARPLRPGPEADYVSL
ncbi:PilZ domain-containing protein [Desulfohalovibrio reitneri]|uniref:PilZ domain-containing protein n=1 Tax=Desulfohalovibrio reitneri TaxID=1307759 RepID=UPI0004A77636|nr:PilZ domain-containing protein [Desulfohalovibrio reitneri]